jgi:hypothetical protein
MLRNSINKPKVLYSDDPTLEYGFLNLITIFEKLTPDLYDWVALGGDEAFAAGPVVANNIQQNLAKPVPIEGMMQIQQVDVLVTQQWLQAMMWKLSMSNSPHPTDTDTLLPFHLPVLVGKALMDVVGSVSQSAIDAHGIGMVSFFLFFFPFQFKEAEQTANTNLFTGAKAVRHGPDNCRRDTKYAV